MSKQKPGSEANFPKGRDQAASEEIPSPTAVPPMLVQMERISISDILVGGGHRPLDEDKVQELMGSIAAMGKGQIGRGLLQPPAVAADRRTLLFGRHRFEAAKRLGWPWLPCHVVGVEGLEAELARIDENLIRFEFTVLRRAEQVARRVEILEALGLRRQPGGQPGPDTVTGPTPKSTKEIARQAGISGRTLQRDARIVHEIPEDLRRLLHGTDVEDSTTGLLRGRGKTTSLF